MAWFAGPEKLGTVGFIVTVHDAVIRIKIFEKQVIEKSILKKVVQTRTKVVQVVYQLSTIVPTLVALRNATPKNHVFLHRT